MTKEDGLLATFIISLIFCGEDITFIGNLSTFKHKGEYKKLLVQRVASDGNEFLFNRETIQGEQQYIMQLHDKYVRTFSLRRLRGVLENNVEHISDSGSNRQVAYSVVKGVVTEYKWEEMR